MSGMRTEGIERDPERKAEVSRGHSNQEQSDHSTGTLARKGRNAKGSPVRERFGEGLNGALLDRRVNGDASRGWDSRVGNGRSTS